MQSHLFRYDRNMRVVKTIIYLSDEVRNLDVWYYNAKADCTSEVNTVNVPIVMDKMLNRKIIYLLQKQKIYFP